MNFLSHYYFDRNNQNPYEVLGTVLPDLIKNADKNWNMHPEKKPGTFTHNNKLRSLLTGWQKHLEIDRYFHNSDFFLFHTKEIKILCKPALENSVVRPSFLAHIALELMLDSLLITEDHIQPEPFYIKLEQVNNSDITKFLILNNINDTDKFFAFFDAFLESRYLNSYKNISSIIHAVNRICMRIWPQALNETQKIQLSAVLIEYHKILKKDFMHIFTDINSYMNK